MKPIPGFKEDHFFITNSSPRAPAPRKRSSTNLFWFLVLLLPCFLSHTFLAELAAPYDDETIERWIREVAPMVDGAA